MAEECTDKNCPIHGNLKVRGQTLEGIVVSDKPKNTVIIERHYLKFVPKYERYERRRSKIAVHKPGCMTVKVGDHVLAGECRKVSKTKAFVLVPESMQNQQPVKNEEVKQKAVASNRGKKKASNEQI